MTRDKSDYNILSGEKNFPTLNQMWDKLQEGDVLRETINWLQKNRTWWNDSAHMGPNAVYMGWSNEYADVFHKNQKLIRELHTLVEIASQCAGLFHVVHNGGVDDGQTTRIHREGEQLRAKVERLSPGHDRQERRAETPGQDPESPAGRAGSHGHLRRGGPQPGRDPDAGQPGDGTGLRRSWRTS